MSNMMMLILSLSRIGNKKWGSDVDTSPHLLARCTKAGSPFSTFPSLLIWCLGISTSPYGRAENFTLREVSTIGIASARVLETPESTSA